MATASPSAQAAPPRVPPDSPSRVPVREVLALDSLVTDGGTQVRSEIDEEVVGEYAQALADGAQFPPVVVFRVDGADFLADGFHRVLAYRKGGRTEVEADVYHGSRDDALWHALGANRAHGQRLKPADKRHAVELAYRAWPDSSQGRIAAQLGCTQQYVSQIRAQLTTSCELPDRVVGIDGRRRAATRPKRSPPPDSPSESGDDSAPAPRPKRTLRAEPRGEFPRESGLDSASSSFVSPDPVDALPVAPSAVGGSDPSSEPGASTPVSSFEPRAGPGATAVAADSGRSDPEGVDSDGCDPEGLAEAGSGGPAAGTDASASLPRSVRERSNRIVFAVAYDAKMLTAQEDLVDFSALDRAEIPAWVEALEESRRSLGRFIRRLRQEVSDVSRSARLED